MTKVLQCDREAAEAVRDEYAAFFEGRIDGLKDTDFTVQAFARHREEAQAELLEACRAAEDFCATIGQPSAFMIYEQLHAAIARAKGETE